MLRSAVGTTSNELNEVSVSSPGAEHLPASDSSHSAEQPSLEVSVEQNRQSDSRDRAEHDRSSFDDIPDIERQPRSRGTSPTSIDSGRGQPMRSRSQSSETYSRGRSRNRKRSNRELDHHRSRDRDSRHRSSERSHHRSSRSDGCSLIPYYMYMYSMYIYIYTLYGIQDPGPCIHVTVYTDPYPVPHETTNTVYH